MTLSFFFASGGAIVLAIAILCVIEMHFEENKKIETFVFYATNTLVWLAFLIAIVFVALVLLNVR